MSEPPLMLGLETSCDETSAAVLRGRDVLSNVVSSQAALHAKYGGVVPEIAARAHIECVGPVLEEARSRAGIEFDQVDAVAVTDGPGLVGSLMIGIAAAKTLSLSLGVPLVPVDHIEAHATSAGLVTDAPPWPAVALVVSGGHSSIYLVRDPLRLELLGQTVDDAAGEAFDKVAALLELGYPGGPRIDKLAREGDPGAIAFPRTWMNEGHFNFSFSGLKTAVMYHVYGPGRKYGSVADRSRAELADIAASFQAAVVEPLIRKCVRAAQEHAIRTVVVGGGVAANSALRRGLEQACAEAGLRLILTPMEYCTDNAAMIAWAGLARLRAGLVGDLSLEPRSGLRRPGRAGRPGLRP